jgi:hypothetical protein
MSATTLMKKILGRGVGEKLFASKKLEILIKLSTYQAIKSQHLMIILLSKL